MANLRNAILYSYWLNGSTIDEASFSTGIPRSSVGYYFRKFKMKAQRGDPIVTPIMTQQNQSNTVTNALKILNLKDIILAMREGDYEYVYKKLMIAKLLKELWTDLFPADEVSKTPSEQYLENFYTGLNRLRELQGYPKNEKKQKKVGQRISFRKVQQRIQRSGRMRAYPNPRKSDD